MDRFTQPGAHIYLRELVPEDINEEYLCWFSDPETNRFLEIKTLTQSDAEEFLVNGTRRGIHHMFAIVEKATDKHIGNLKIGPIDWELSVSDLVTVIGDRSFDGRGFGTEAIKIGQHIAFNTYDIRTLSAQIYEPNIASLKAYTRSGWAKVDRRKDAFKHNGVWTDEILVENYNPRYFIKDEAGVRPISPDSHAHD
jgi:RimJ/RimL family protein N-acetyltransferase